MIKLIPFLLLFASCKTIKYVDRVRTVTDSTVIEQNEGLQRTLAETIERYESQIESINKTGIIFDTVYRDTGSITRVTFFDNGKIKSAEGRIKSISVDLKDRETALLDAHSTIDSLAIEIERKDAQLSKQVTTVTKEVKRTVYPWWIFIICLIAGLLIEWKYKILKRIL
jgi:hypothetical protein